MGCARLMFPILIKFVSNWPGLIGVVGATRFIFSLRPKKSILIEFTRHWTASHALSFGAIIVVACRWQLGPFEIL